MCDVTHSFVWRDSLMCVIHLDRWLSSHVWFVLNFLSHIIQIHAYMRMHR